MRGLRTTFATRDGMVRAVDGIDFHVDRGEIMGLVGESGCGKSVTSLSILRLIGSPGRVEAGEVIFDGTDLLKIGDDEMRQIRGDRISMIFQQPTSSLNPVWDVGARSSEVLEIHRDMKRTAARARAAELLRMVGIPDPERRLKAYPHEMSGGMAQRVMIAMALACEPELLIADEPTTALDVTIQAQILDLMRELRDETGTAIILITHDLGVVAEMCDRVAVMYAGRDRRADRRARRSSASRGIRTPRASSARSRSSGEVQRSPSRSSRATSPTSSTCRRAAGSRPAAPRASSRTSRWPPRSTRAAQPGGARPRRPLLALPRREGRAPELGNAAAAERVERMDVRRDTDPVPRIESPS